MSTKKELYIHTVEQVEEHIRERIRFREQRFYWLYVGNCAIAAFLVNTYKPDSTAHLALFFGGLFLIHILTIGIGWNYFANDIKIQKFEWRKNKIYHMLDVDPVGYDNDGMKAYCVIYAVFETLGISLPSFGACVAICWMCMCKTLEGLSTTIGEIHIHVDASGVSQVVNLVLNGSCSSFHYIPVAFASIFLFLLTFFGSALIAFKKKTLFDIKDNNHPCSSH